MSQELIYICINLHGGVCTAGNTVKTSAEVLIPPSEISVQKLSITVPGTTGFNNKFEYSEAKELLKENPNITAEDMSKELIKAYKSTIKKRQDDDRYWVDIERKENNDIINRDISLFNIKEQNFMEPNEFGQFIKKTYEIDKNYEQQMFSIEILNGPFQGENMISRDFLSMYIQFNKFNKERWHTFDNGTTVLERIDLDEIITTLISLGIFNVFIIDTSCSSNFNGSTARDERGLKRRYINNINNPLTRQFSGEQIVMLPVSKQFNKGGKKYKTKKYKTKKYKTKKYKTKKYRKIIKYKTLKNNLIIKNLKNKLL